MVRVVEKSSKWEEQERHGPFSSNTLKESDSWEKDNARTPKRGLELIFVLKYLAC